MLLPGMIIKTGLRKVKSVLKIFSLCSYILIRHVRSITNTRKWSRREFKYGIMVMSSRQFANRIQKVDFLIDGKVIKNSDVLFISYRRIKKEYRAYLNDNKLSYVDALDSYFSARHVLRAILEYFMLIIRPSDAFLTDMSASIVHYHLRWTSITRAFGFDALVTHCDFLTQSIVRNIVLNKSGCVTFYYMDSANLGIFLQKKGNPAEYRHSNFGFLYYDYFLGWNEPAIDFFKRSHCEIRNYVNVGCLWSEHLELVRRGEIKSVIIKKLRDHGYREGMKLMAVFDSSLHDNSFTTCSDGIEFLKGIRKLLDDLPDVFVVIKEKMATHFQTDGKQQDLTMAYDRLRSHARCYAADKKDNPSEIMAFSDMMISFPFTSTSFEALSARKRAIWYDAAGKFRDTFFAAIPGLVCHDYKELFERSNDLLFKTGEDDYNRYLDSQIKGRVELYLDCKAITRIRRLLNGSLTIKGLEYAANDGHNVERVNDE